MSIRVISLVISLLLGAAAASADIVTGLVAHWKLNEASGTSVADSAGTNTGTLTNGSTWGQGRIGGAVDLDGTDDYVNIPDAAALRFTDASSLTVSLWVSLDSLAVDQSVFLNAGNGAGDFEVQINVLTAPRLIGGICKNTVACNETPIGFIPTTGVWYHVAISYNGNTLTLYVDGIQRDTVTKSTVVTTTASDGFKRIGNHVSNTWHTNGRIDDVRVYNVAKTAQDVHELYSLGRRRGLVLP